MADLASKTGRLPQNATNMNPFISSGINTNMPSSRGLSNYLPSDKKDITGKRLKKNMIKQRAGKTTSGVNNMFGNRKQVSGSGFNPTQTLQTGNHLESISPNREPENQYGSI